MAGYVAKPIVCLSTVCFRATQSLLRDYEMLLPGLRLFAGLMAGLALPRGAQQLVALALAWHLAPHCSE